MAPLYFLQVAHIPSHDAIIVFECYQYLPQSSLGGGLHKGIFSEFFINDALVLSLPLIQVFIDVVNTLLLYTTS